ncbi:MAG: hypothetical protein QHH15_04865 [Candidatus Thermoplasmatota archaeon]|nr:hypothetical protein [Candidatus Thermoplasmatota archaeon]
MELVPLPEVKETLEAWKKKKQKKKEEKKEKPGDDDNVKSKG